MAPLPRNDTSRPLLICGTRTLAEEITDIVSEIPGMRVAGYVENWEPARALDECHKRIVEVYARYAKG